MKNKNKKNSKNLNLNLNYEELKIFNSRILYIVCNLDEFNFVESMAILNEAIMSCSHLDFESNSVFLYFFTNLNDKSIKSHDVWISREITGFPTDEILKTLSISSRKKNSFEVYEFGYHDFNAGKIYSTNLPNSLESFNLKKLCTNFNKAFNELDAKETKFASTWRVKYTFKHTASRKSELESCQLQVFELD
jgi:hypothetical protein